MNTCSKTLLMALLFYSAIVAQNEWPLQPWVQVIGSDSGRQLGRNVGYLGKKNDSTLISVSDGDGFSNGSGKIYIYQMKSPTDTVPKYTLNGLNCYLGDFNGDGIKDLLISGNPTRIYLGKSEGVFDTIPFYTKYSEPDNDRWEFGTYVAIGKIDGDKYDDLIVTDYEFPKGTFWGRVYLFLGGTQMDTVCDAVLNGTNLGNGFGRNVVTGDLNNDGFDDIIVRGYDTQNTNQRFCYDRVYLGGNTVDTNAWKYLKGGNSSLPGLACFDVNGDGIKDLLWMNWDSMYSINVHYGGTQFDTIPSMRLQIQGVGDFGNAIINAGDMNGDGYNDIAVAAYRATLDQGLVFIFSAGPQMDNKYDAAVGLGGVSDFGSSIAGVGDVNGDGLSDIIVGAPAYRWYSDKGYWAVLLGDRHIPVTRISPQRVQQREQFELLQNYPNPFNPSTMIEYDLAMRSRVRLCIVDVLGQHITTLCDQEQPAGYHTVQWNANVSSGIYFYRIEATAMDDPAKHFVDTRKMLLLR